MEKNENLDIVSTENVAPEIAKPVRVITSDVVASAGLRNGMSVEDVDAAIEAVFIRRGE